jgi:CHAD domain-containing protein
VRRFTRALGPVREVDVALDLVPRIARAEPSVAAAASATERHLAATRDAVRGVMLAALAPDKVQKLHGTLARLRTTTDDDGLRWRKALADRVASRAGGLRAALDDAGVLYDAARLHRVRIAAKKLRYSLELVGDARVAATTRLVKALKKAQDALGALHDLQMLAHHVATVRERHRGDAALEAGLDALGRMLDERCLAMHAEFLPSRAALRKLADTANDAVAPRVLAAVPVRPLPRKRSQVA